MSSTRHAKPGAPLSQERYMSSPEFAEVQGVNGVAVTAKARLCLDPADKRLLFWLQAMSLREGGVPRMVRELLELFPERIGTPTMHRLGLFGDKRASGQVLETVLCELGDTSAILRESNGYEPRMNLVKTGTELVDMCLDRASRLEWAIFDVCLNPAVWPAEPGQGVGSKQRMGEGLDEGSAPPAVDRAWAAGGAIFRDLPGALAQWQERAAESAISGCAKTKTFEHVMEALDFCLQTRSMVVVEGPSRIGKSTAAKSWCEQHLGDARYVSLTGICHKTGFFRLLSRALGLACSFKTKSTEMQSRVEDTLQRSGLMLVIDEAHFLWPQNARIYSGPELVDWIDTAFCNYNAPIALVSTPQFSFCKRQAVQQTGWNARQFELRVKRHSKLPESVSEADLAAVAKTMLPGAASPIIKVLVGYALLSKRYLQAIVDTVDEAKIIARKSGRDTVEVVDIKQALDCYRFPSDQAMAASAVAPRKSKRRPDPSTPHFASGLQARRFEPAGHLPIEGRAAGSEVCSRPSIECDQPLIADRTQESRLRPEQVEA